VGLGAGFSAGFVYYFICLNICGTEINPYDFSRILKPVELSYGHNDIIGRFVSVCAVTDEKSGIARGANNKNDNK